MPRHPRQLAESGIYHVMLRGVNRDSIFLDDDDCARFLHSLGQAKDASGCRVLAYCLMSNHAHLVIRTGDEPIGAVIKRLGVRYAGWFNRKYGRVGHLFQDRFKSLPVEDDAYFVTLLRYVWNNPVEAGLVDLPEEYFWSSRRLLGLESPLVDGEQLRKLLPDDPLAWVASPRLQLLDEPTVKRVRQPGHSEEHVAELLHRACGVRNPTDFLLLDPSTQQRAIRELRTRSVAYAQIAKVSGLSTSTVRRLHAAELPGPIAPLAPERCVLETNNNS
jgi:putative transposase